MKLNENIVNTDMFSYIQYINHSSLFPVQDILSRGHTENALELVGFFPITSVSGPTSQS